MANNNDNSNDDIDASIIESASIMQQKKDLENLQETVIKYIKTDKLIKTKMQEQRDEIKVLKTAKKKLEEYIIKYLDETQNDEKNKCLSLGKHTLIKNSSITKESLKYPNIEKSILEQIKSARLISDNNECEKFIKNIIESIEKNRATKNRVYIKQKKNKP
jgi:hypothetical protein